MLRDSLYFHFPPKLMVPGKEGGVPLGPSQPAHGAKADQEGPSSLPLLMGPTVPPRRPAGEFSLAQPLFRPARGLSSPTHLLVGISK